MSKNSDYDYLIENMGIKIFRLLRKVKWDPSIIFPLRRLIKNINPNIIHSYSSLSSFYISLIKKNNVNFVDSSIRNALPIKEFKEKLIYKLIYKTADVILVNSYAGLRAKKVPEEKSHVLYNGFNLNRINNLKSPNEVKQILGIGSEKIVGMVANFSKFKDNKSFINAAQKVLEKRAILYSFQ